MTYHKRALKAQRKNVKYNLSFDALHVRTCYFVMRYPLRLVYLAYNMLGWILEWFRGVRCEICNDTGFTFMWPELFMDPNGSTGEANDPNKYCNCLTGEAVKAAVEYLKERS